MDAASAPAAPDVASPIPCRAGLIYRLAAGRAALCAGDAVRAGTLRPLAEMTAGDTVFVPPDNGRLQLAILPGAGAEVAVLSAPLPAAGFAEGADRWVRLAARMLRGAGAAAEVAGPEVADAEVADAEVAGAEAAGAEAAEAAAEVTGPARRLSPGEAGLAAGEGAVPAQADAVLWCRVISGAVAGVWRTAPQGPGAAASPLLREAPAVAVADSRLGLAATGSLAADGSLAAVLAAFGATVADCLTVWLDAQERALSHRLAAAADADAAVLAGALQQLGGQAVASVSPHGYAEAPVVAMLRLAAEAAGAVLPADLAPPIGADSVDEFIKVLAEGAGLRARRVRLRPRWWHASGEAMLAFLPDGTPVALIPEGRRWLLHRPDGRVQTVSRDGPGIADDMAYVLYRGFGETVARPGRALFAFTAARVRPELALILLTSLLVGLLGLATPFLTGFLVQTVIPDGIRSEVEQLVAAVLAVSCGVTGFELARGLTVLRAESLLGSSIEGALWNRMLRLPVGFFRRFGAGDLALRADAVNQMRRTLGFATLTALVSALFSLVNLAVLFSYGLAPALLALGVCAVEIALIAAQALFNGRLQRRALENAGRMQTLTVQIFQGLSKLRVAAAESRLLARWVRLFAVDQSLHYRANVAGNAVTAFGAGWNILVMAALIAIVGFGFSPMTLGDYVTYSGVFGQFVAATLSLAGIIPALATVGPLWGRARPILSEPEENAGRGLHPGRLSGAIEVVRASFSYPGGEPALHDISLRVPAGAFVAVVGPSGSGKSTLLRVLIGFETPAGGQVLLDGRNLTDLDAGAVRRQLGVVLQHSRLEAGSIYQNIAGAAPLSAAQAWAAAECAGLAADLSAMPMGIHTYVDDNGTTLSGGQRQRLLLARAIARRPRILLLDEATSALDNVVQARVMAALADMNATRIVVAHRLSTVRHADLIVVMDAGRIVETGTYDSLAAAGGLFSDLIRRQMA